MFSEGIAGFLTFTLPIVLVVMFFLCFFRFLFRCCSRMPEPIAAGGTVNTAAHRCPHHCEAGSKSWAIISQLFPCTNGLLSAA